MTSPGTLSTGQLLAGPGGTVSALVITLHSLNKSTRGRLPCSPHFSFCLHTRVTDHCTTSFNNNIPPTPSQKEYDSRGDPNGSTTPPSLLLLSYSYIIVSSPRGGLNTPQQHSTTESPCSRPNPDLTLRLSISKNIGESSLLIAAVVSAGLRPPKNSVNHHPTTDINQPNQGKQPPTTLHLLTY